jgi:hypothetical protein
METSRRPLSSYPSHPWVYLVILLALFLVSLGDGVDLNLNLRWLLVPRPPLPSSARNVQTMYTTWGGSRIIRFETDQPAEGIRDFYRSEMPKHGWYFSCSSEEPEAQECQTEYNYAIVERYKRDDDPSMVQGFSIFIFKAGEQASDLENSNNRIVEVGQARYPVSWLTPQPIPETTKGEILYTPGVYPAPGSPSPTPPLRPAYP